MSVRFGLDEVNGVVIGGYSKRVALFSPNGGKHGVEWIGEEDDAAAWGKAKRAECMARICGDGKPVSAHPDLCRASFGEGDWEVRVYD